MPDHCAVVGAPVDRAHGHLKGDIATAFRLLAVPASQQLTASSAATALGVPESRSLAALEQLVEAHLLVADPQGSYYYPVLVKAYARRLAWTEDGPERCRAVVRDLADYYLASSRAAVHCPEGCAHPYFARTCYCCTSLLYRYEEGRFPSSKPASDLERSGAKGIRTAGLPHAMHKCAVKPAQTADVALGCDVRETAEEASDRDLAFQTCQRRAHAMMNAMPERDVIIDSARDVKPVRLTEVVLIAITCQQRYEPVVQPVSRPRLRVLARW
jgi:hypothetical protein